MSIMAGMRCLNATCIQVGNAKIMATLDGNDFDKFVLKLSLLRYFVLACNSSWRAIRPALGVWSNASSFLFEAVCRHV